MEILCLSTSKINEKSQTFGLLISKTTGQIYLLDMSNNNTITDSSNYTFLLCFFQSEDIISVKDSKWKKLVTTFIYDKSVQIWNYINLKIKKFYFWWWAFKVTFHPNGLFLGILFKKYIKYVNI